MYTDFFFRSRAPRGMHTRPAPCAAPGDSKTCDVARRERARETERERSAHARGACVPALGPRITQMKRTPSPSHLISLPPSLPLSPSLTRVAAAAASPRDEVAKRTHRQTLARKKERKREKWIKRKKRKETRPAEHELLREKRERDNKCRK